MEQHNTQLRAELRAHFGKAASALEFRPVMHGQRLKRNVWHVSIGAESYLLKRHRSAAPAFAGGYTAFEIERRVLSVLHRNGCRVPKVIWHAADARLLLLENCGAPTLDSLAQREPLSRLAPIVATAVRALCRIESVFRENAAALTPYIFSFDRESALTQLLEQGERTLRYLCDPLPASAAAAVARAWGGVSAQLHSAPATLDSLDYQSRNIVVSGETPTFLDFGSIGWEWQERRLIQYFNSIGADQADATFVSLLTREQVEMYARWVSDHRESCSADAVAARVDGHHLLFYLSVIHHLLRAVAAPDAPESRVRLAAWGDPKRRYRGALRQLCETRLSDDFHTTTIREHLSAARSAAAEVS